MGGPAPNRAVRTLQARIHSAAPGLARHEWREPVPSRSVGAPEGDDTAASATAIRVAETIPSRINESRRSARCPHMQPRQIPFSGQPLPSVAAPSVCCSAPVIRHYEVGTGVARAAHRTREQSNYAESTCNRIVKGALNKAASHDPAKFCKSPTL